MLTDKLHIFLDFTGVVQHRFAEGIACLLVGVLARVGIPALNVGSAFLVLVILPLEVCLCSLIQIGKTPLKLPCLLHAEIIGDLSGHCIEGTLQVAVRPGTMHEAVVPCTFLQKVCDLFAVACCIEQASGHIEVWLGPQAVGQTERVAHNDDRAALLVGEDIDLAGLSSDPLVVA